MKRYHRKRTNKLQYIVLGIILLIAIILSFITRTQNFSDIVDYSGDKDNQYKVSLTVWENSLERLNYDLDYEMASGIISFLDKHDYKRNLISGTFEYDNKKLFHSLKLFVFNNIDIIELTLYPDGTLMVDELLYEMQFSDSEEAKISEEEMIDIYHQLLELEEN